ncbi:helix-turn-helix transcriptional regulator [Streptomyces sp. NPDC000658]|uniref:helix-turn-helix domain-containing protein n=1 Tax=Streptomyces sp. NPDC000658 TaxID=3154266 RepID=UPI00332E43EE
MAAAEEIAEFAALMRELKQRSGLSYETLAKRAHMSTSTLHRYCKGEGVPGDNAAVARFARVCRATPEELGDLHRRWVLADAARERARRAAADVRPDGAEPHPAQPRAAAPAPPRPPAEPDAPPCPAAETAGATAGETAGETGDPPASTAGPSPQAAAPAAPPAPAVPPAAAAAAPARTTPTPVVAVRAGRAVRRRWARIAAGAAVAVAVTTALTFDLRGRETGGLAGDGGRTGAVASSGPRAASSSTTGPSASPSPSTPSSLSPTSSPGAPDATPSGRGADADRAPHGDAPPLTVSTRTYAWEDPQCEGKYLIDRPPGQVSPPVMGQDVPGWVKAQGAVAADGQRVALTVQGVGDETVVIESLHVRVVDSVAPPAWNAYLGSSGCGGGVETRSFATDLDAVHPAIVPKAGQRGVPYKVSRSDPEVLYITAHVRAHDVKWYVELQWSSGGRQGTVRIDDHGKPFRTSGSRGRPVHEYLLGGTEWLRVEENTG